MRAAARLVAAVTLTAATGLVHTPAPAQAAACGTDTGVTVVVDFHELGGGVQQVCDPGGGGDSAAELFPDNGYPLDYVQRQPGFVCRVSGKPADDPCVNTPPSDAYWGLWWSNGDSGSWTYSSEGAASLNIPDGGSVAFSWNGSSTKSPPGVAPATHDDEASPTSSPAPDGSGGDGGGGGTDGSAGGSVRGTGPTSGPSSGDEDTTRDGERRTGGGKGSGDRSKRDRDGRGDATDEESASATPGETSTATPEAAVVADPPTASSDDALPAWVAPALVGGLFAVAGVVAIIRRRTAA
jgi:hypothetical protein